VKYLRVEYLRVEYLRVEYLRVEYLRVKYLRVKYLRVKYLRVKYSDSITGVNPLNTELNPNCHLLPLLAHHILHVSRIRVK
jgi:hypothetical protein